MLDLTPCETTTLPVNHCDHYRSEKYFPDDLTGMPEYDPMCVCVDCEIKEFPYFYFIKLTLR
ncbi:MAG: hypothetical protein DID92_2727744387 [Candidatus Nitrotoga sp. SPKER]|nr:MAG: hypothetical protein DID92_2727744387 [Candidatus Nitrotoga sp. SPKER]